MNPNLTLEEAKKTARQREAVQEQQQLLKAGESKDNPISVEGIKGTQRQPRHREQPKHRERQQKQRDQAEGKKGKDRQWSKSHDKCTRCGRGPHARVDCPAKEAACHKCGKKGLYASQCFSKVEKILEESNIDGVFLDTVRKDNNVAWITNVTALGKDIPFKMDTGAEVTVVSEETHRILGSPHLEEPSKVLYGPGHKPLSVRGKFISTLVYKERAVQQPV